MDEQYQNPCGLDGFAFLEFSGNDQQVLINQFSRMGFEHIATHKTADIYLFKQNNIQFIINATSNSQASKHAKIHGEGVCAMGFYVKDAQKAFDYAITNGAHAFIDESQHPHNLLAIDAIGGSVIYFVDNAHKPFAKEWEFVSKDTIKSSTIAMEQSNNSAGLTYIDHLTHNVYRGNMDKWAKFYESIFNFREIRFFNIVGKLTGLISRALSSPCGKIKIPLNESKDDKSQIEEFLHEYHGEGIQHMALATDNIYNTVNTLEKNGVMFLDVPTTYYEMIDNRIPWHKESIENLQKNRILIDGEKDEKLGLLLQIFTQNVFGPVFFEIIQRKGNQGFGEGNFQALFEAIERDQVRRGTLEANKT